MRGVAVVAAAAVLGGCGHCDGAIRSMQASTDGDPVAPDVSFTLTADGPGSMSSDELLADAGITPDTWTLYDGAGRPVAATLFGDWGGHVCLNGNTFTLVPDAPLEPGEHTLVLRIDALAWEYIGDAAPGSWDGEPALVQEYVVAE